MQKLCRIVYVRIGIWTWTRRYIIKTQLCNRVSPSKSLHVIAIVWLWTYGSGCFGAVRWFWSSNRLFKNDRTLRVYKGECSMTVWTSRRSRPSTASFWVGYFHTTGHIDLTHSPQGGAYIVCWNMVNILKARFFKWKWFYRGENTSTTILWRKLKRIYNRHMRDILA